MPRILRESHAKDVAAEREPARGEPFWASKESATAIEYGLIAALSALACAIAVTSLRLNLARICDTISNALRDRGKDFIRVAFKPIRLS